MTSKIRNLSPQILAVLVGVAGLLVLVAGVFFLVLPQRHKAASLSAELVKTQTQIVTARALASQPPEQRIRIADLFKVVQAMPDDTDMTGVILQLQQTASEAGVTFDSIQPGPLAAGQGYGVVPIDLGFTGNYFSLTDFLYRLRKLVTVHRGTLDATGRLFSVSRIDFAPGAKGFPSVTATVSVNAYVYSPAAVGTSTAPPLPTDTTQTPAPSGAQASGATP